MKYEQYEIGDMVRFMDMKAHLAMPQFYPQVGTIGKIIYINNIDESLKVQWEFHSTSKNDIWCCYMTQVEKIQ